MKTLLSVAVVLLGTLVSWAATAAANSAFYVAYISTKQKMVVLLDQSTLTLVANNHVTAHFATVRRYDLWVDDTVEMDCASNMEKLCLRLATWVAARF